RQALYNQLRDNIPQKKRTQKEFIMKQIFMLSACAAALAFSAPAFTAPAKWDLPTAYPASNLHTENLQQFVKDVKEFSNGEFDITLHINASLFKAPEIKRAVQSNQAQ